MKLFWYALLLITQITIHTSASNAEPQPAISGADSPVFQEALTKWLDGEDIPALEIWAALAREGNPAAQVFLARVASTGYLHLHATRDMPRRERIALLRNPKGLSGQSWMEVAQETTPLATAFMQMGNKERRADAIRALLDYGEASAAMRSIKSLLWYGDAAEVIDILATYENVPQSASFILSTAILMNRINSGGSTGSGGVNERWIFENVITRMGNRVAPEDYLAWQPVDVRSLDESPKDRALAYMYSRKVPAFEPIV